MMTRMAGMFASMLPASTLVLLVGCGGPIPAVPAQPDVARYDTESQWLCLPGRNDACAGDLTTTVIEPDGTKHVEADIAPAAAPKADCFYVYPTVDLDLMPGNHTDFHDLAPMGDVALAQAARFRASCAVYAPLYRQVTIGAYVAGGESLEKRLVVAYADVEAAFLWYLKNENHGRPIVLVGHSQGAEMVTRLLAKYFDHDAEMKKRLLLAMPIGGWVEVAKGQKLHGSFEAIPVCSAADELGCVIAFRSFEEGAAFDLAKNKPSAASLETACVSPANDAVLASAYFPVTKRTRRRMKGIDDVTTPWVAYPQLYAAHCADGGEGFHYLAVSSVKDDHRTPPFALSDVPFRKVLGLHILDFQIAQGDLVRQVAHRIEKLP